MTALEGQMAGPVPTTRRAPHFLTNQNRFPWQILTKEEVPGVFQKDLNWGQQDSSVSKALTTKAQWSKSNPPQRMLKQGSEKWLQNCPLIPPHISCRTCTPQQHTLLLSFKKKKKEKNTFSFKLKKKRKEKKNAHKKSMRGAWERVGE